MVRRSVFNVQSSWKVERSTTFCLQGNLMFKFPTALIIFLPLFFCLCDPGLIDMRVLD
jgi:hypothetical protein